MGDGELKVAFGDGSEELKKGAILVVLCEQISTTKNVLKGTPRMQLKVILNSIERHKGFVYQDAYWDPDIKKKNRYLQT